jgi:zinc protease
LEKFVNQFPSRRRLGRRPRHGAAPAVLLAAALLSPLLPAALVPARAQTPAPAATAKPPARPARLDYRVATLANGLKVITLEDRRAPVVTLQVWYRVGSKDEAPGKAGFAHLFEHLMFKGSKNVGPEEHSRLVEAIGGNYNANTFFDRTLYYETVPSNALDRMLFLEADRMASLRVDQKNLTSERDVVKEERRLRVENPPYGTLLEKVLAAVYPAGHPYAHTTIGLAADLDAARLGDVRAFHEEYYKPDNATLVLVGDFKTDEALAKIRKYFGAIPKSRDGDFVRYPVPAITQTAERRDVYNDPLAPLPLVGMAFRLPEPASPDTPVFDVMAQILSQGQSSRLYRSLVRDQQLAIQASGQKLDLRLGGLFFFFAVANAGKAPADLERALIQQVEQLRAEPVTEAELAKARNQALTAYVFGNLSTEQKATALGEADLLYGDPEEANRYFDKLSRVSADDVRRVAQKYFAPESRTVFQMLPPGRNTPASAADVAAAATVGENK